MFTNPSFWTGCFVGLIAGGSLGMLCAGLMIMQEKATPEDDAEQADALRDWLKKQPPVR